MEFEIEEKKNLLYVRIDRKRKILVTTFLRVLGYETREDIINLFYKQSNVKIETKEEQDSVLRRYVSKDIYINEDDEVNKEKIVQAGTRLTPLEIDKFVQADIKEIPIIDFEHKDSVHHPIIINCFEKEEVIITKEEPFKDEPSKFDCIVKIYSVLKPGEPTTVENAEREIRSMFFSEKRYELGSVGRYKLNKKFDFDLSIKDSVLRNEDIVEVIKYLIMVYNNEGSVDDIDHLGNRRIRSVGELLLNQLKVAFTRVERIAKERMQLKEIENVKASDLISVKPITASINEFFGTSQLSNLWIKSILSELTHKRRLNALGPVDFQRQGWF